MKWFRNILFVVLLCCTGLTWGSDSGVINGKGGGSGSNVFIDVTTLGAQPNGTSDCTAAIQAAVTALPATGGAIFFKAGASFYKVSGGIDFTGKNNVSIQSDGAEIRVANSTVDTQYGSWPTFGQDSMLRFVGVSGITIQGLTLNGNIQNRTAHATTESFNCCVLLAACSNVVIRDCTFKNGMTDGLCIVRNSVNTKCSDIHVLHCTMDSNRRQGISVVDVNRCWIEDCQLINTGVSQGCNPMSGLDIEPDLTTSLPRVSQVWVRHNVLDGNLGTYALSVGGTGSDSVSIENNDILFAKDFGVNFDAYSNSYTSNNGKLIDNRIGVSTSATGVQSAGIRCVAKNCDVVKGNRVKGAMIAGVSAFDSDGLIIENNYFEGCTGVSATDVTLPVKRIHIRRNDFIDNTPVAAGGPWYCALLRPASTSAIIEFDYNFVMNSAGASNKSDGAFLYSACKAYARWNTCQNLNSTYAIATPNFQIMPVMAMDGGNRFGALFNAPSTGGGYNFESGQLFVNDNVIGSGSAAPTGAPTWDTTWHRGDLQLNSQGGAGNPIGWMSRSISATPSWDPWYAMLGSPGEGKVLRWEQGFLGFTTDAPRTIWSIANDYTLTGSTAEATAFVITIPANTLLPNGNLALHVCTKQTNNGNAKTLRFKFNGSIINTGTLDNRATSVFDTTIGNWGGNVQHVVNGSFNGGWTGTDTATAADMTVSQDITITYQLANGADSMGIIMGTAVITNP